MTEMTIIEKLMLGFNTTFIGMGIVFIVLVVLSLVVAVQTKLLNLVPKKANQLERTPQSVQGEATFIERKGATSGETVVVGVEDQETLAVIMAIVSQEADVPLSELKFKSIKAL